MKKKNEQNDMKKMTQKVITRKYGCSSVIRSTAEVGIGMCFQKHES